MASQISDNEPAISLPLRSRPDDHPSSDQSEHESSQQSNHDPPVDASSAVAGAENGPEPPLGVAKQSEPSEIDPPAPDAAPSEVGLETEEKKKKKKKSKSKKKTPGASGFEEYYVDPPVTPEEFEQEAKMYSLTKPFTLRIQIAIQRYSAKRKFDETRRGFWLQYLKFGGINTGPKPFGGIEAKDLPDDATAEDIITLRATEYIAKDIIDDEQSKQMTEDHDPRYVVDFEGVTRCFFSIAIQSHFDLSSPDKIKTFCGIVRNWLNYLLHHNVCTEYNDDINAARKVVNQAEKELLDLIELPGLLPGTFSSACKAIYVDLNQHRAGYHWGSVSLLDNLSKDDATRIFLAALAAMGSDELCDLYEMQNDEGTTGIVETLDTGLEITGIFPPNPQVRGMYAHAGSHGLTPIGHVTARTWWCPWAPQEDMTEEEEADLPAKQAAATHDYTIWMDEETLKKLSLGMKMTADIHKLSFGLWFIENAKLLYPSYSLWIPNDTMEDWREHVLLPPKRAAQRLEEFHQREEAKQNSLELIRGEDVEGYDEEDEAAEKDTAGEQDTPEAVNGEGHEAAVGA